MQRYDINGQHMWESEKGEFVRFQDARAEIERRGRELNLAKYGAPDFSWSIHKEAMSELLARAEKAEAERDEARAQVATLMKDRAELAQIIDSAITPNDAETHRLLLDGTYHTGPVVDWVHRVMIAMRDLLRKTPADAQAALEAYGREKVGEGMQRAAEICEERRQAWLKPYILAEMEALK